MCEVCDPKMHLNNIKGKHMTGVVHSSSCCRRMGCDVDLILRCWLETGELESTIIIILDGLVGLDRQFTHFTCFVIFTVGILTPAWVMSQHCLLIITWWHGQVWSTGGHWTISDQQQPPPLLILPPSHSLYHNIWNISEWSCWQLWHWHYPLQQPSVIWPCRAKYCPHSVYTVACEYSEIIRTTYLVCDTSNIFSFI